MNHLPLALLAAASFLPLRTAEPTAPPLPPAASRTIDFRRHVRPILERSCVACHGPDKQRGGFRLDDRQSALLGADSGIVLKPGDAAGSRLLDLVAGRDPQKRMPPDKHPP